MIVISKLGIARAAALGILSATIALTSGTGAAAAASAARWALTVVPTPTHLVPESPRSQQDSLTVDASGGTYRITLATGKDVVSNTGALAYDASAPEVERAFNEALAAANVRGEVAVSETSSAPARHVYRLAWGGAAADESMAVDEVQEITGETAHLTGAGDAVTIAPTVTGVSEGQILVTATNVGGAATSGEVALSDVLPAGLTATTVQGHVPYAGHLGFVPMACKASPAPACTWKQTVLPGETLNMTISVAVAGGLPAAVTDQAHVEGGGAEPVGRSESLPVSSEPAPFGIARGSVLATLADPEAGAHSNITTAFDFATSEPNVDSATPKDGSVELPRGFVGRTVGMARCSMSKVSNSFDYPEECPRDAIVGMATVTAGYVGRTFTVASPVYNIAPAPGEPAAFGFVVLIAPVRLDTSVLSNGNYAVKVGASNINEGVTVIGVSITMWGVPAQMSGPGPALAALRGPAFGAPEASMTPVPLLTNPQQCSEALRGSASADSWIEPGRFVSEAVEVGKLTGCDKLRFSSSFSMLPDTLEAGAPAGYNFDLRVPQNEAPFGTATPNVRDVKVTLPAGTVINPSAAWGLKACSNAQFYGPHRGSQEPASAAECPREAQVGTVLIKSPDLEEALEGQVYLAQPECDPCTRQDAKDGRMVRLFVQALSEGEGGIVVKLEGHGRVNQENGQITTEFNENPQLPFSELKLKLNGGPRAVLANPRSCGPVSSSIELSPWSAPETPASLSSYGFDVNQNCFGPQFAPSFDAGMPNIQAGAHGEFTLAFGRGDQSQFLEQITMQMPPGLLGTLSGVELCRDAQAIAGTCGPGSEVGSTQVLTGPGADPFLVQGGRVYLTEGYGGSQFGLSIVVPAVAGPYTLGGINGEGGEADNGQVVVRSRLYVNPITTQLTAVSEPLPSMLDGIPLQLRAVNVRLNRPGFMFNPTSCERMAITASIASQEGMSANVSSPFQVTNCAGLGFAPKLTASTSAKSSRKYGASLRVAIAYPQGAQGSQANIHEVKVELPKALPSELKTLQHACIASQFEANPAGCPKESIVGHAKAITPIVPVPLEGPAYFVSYGSQRWPELVLVLQGYGITVDLHGETFINESGVTSSTFKTVPDDPVQSFEITLPEQEYSALGAPGGKLCAKSLQMPTYIVGQNGKTLQQSTKIAVEGCPYALSIQSRKQAKGILTLKVALPAAGRLTLTGRGVKRRSAKSSTRSTVTIRLRLPKGRRVKATHGRNAKRHHARRRPKLKLKLVFVPAAHNARKLTKTIAVKLPR
ncbi:MAG: hypothetical protein ACYCUM_08595 [Solirubrobacteraceae bacterium]